MTRCQTSSRLAWEASRRRRADPVQVETLTTQQVRQACTTDSVSALANDQQVAGADPAGLAWSAVYYVVIRSSVEQDV